MSVTNIPAPGSPIRSNWAQSVSGVANANEAAIPTKVAKAGDTMTGTLQVGGNPATNQVGASIRADGPINSRLEPPSGTGSTNIALDRAGSPTADVGGIFTMFRRGATVGGSLVIVGSITVGTGGGSVVYNTTSDRRLKDEIGPIPDALERIAALRPITFTWKGDPASTPVDGFLADEVAAPFPAAVTGTPDAVDVDGNIVAQQLDLSALVAPLVAAVQALAARVEALEAAP